MKPFGLRSPGEVVNYLSGTYVNPSLRAVKSVRTIEVLKLLGLTRKEADQLGFTKSAITLVLDHLNMRSIEATWDYLLKSGYSQADIAKAPFILAFSLFQIKDLLTEKPKAFSAKFNHTSDKVEKLNIIVKTLDNIYDQKFERFYKRQKSVD